MSTTDSTVTSKTPAVEIAGEMVDVLVNPPSTPINETSSPIDFKTGRDVIRHCRITKIAPENGLVTGDVVWIGDGIVADASMEVAARTLLDEESRRNAMMLMPLDRGGVVFAEIASGKVVKSRLCKTKESREAALRMGMTAGTLNIVVLLVRPDIQVPPDLASTKAVKLPDVKELLGFRTVPLTWHMAKNRMPMPATVKKLVLSFAGGVGTITALVALVMLVQALWPDSPPPPAALTPQESAAGALDALLTADVPAAEPAAQEDAATSVDGEPPGGEVPQTPVIRGSIRWDIPAWTWIASSRTWSAIAVKSVEWRRAPNGGVTVTARGDNSPLWTSFAKTWGNASIDGDSIRRTLDGGYDVRQSLGSISTAKEFCSRSHGRMEDEGGMMRCEVSSWDGNRWRTAGRFFPSGRMVEAVCQYETGIPGPTECAMTFEFNS